MNGIKSLITSFQPKVVNSPKTPAKKIVLEQADDVFVRSDNTRELATSFRKNVLEPFDDWENFSIPKDNQDGSEQLKKVLTPFINVISKYDKTKAETFTRLIMGENQVKQFEDASIRNSTVREFVETLEKALGSTLRKFVVKD